MGLIAEGTKSMAIAMIVPLVGYIYITYYALSGSKINGEHDFTQVNILKSH